MGQVTIAAVTISNWQGNTAGVALRIYCNSSFTAADGTLVPQSQTANPASLGTFYQSIACTVASGSLQIPAVTLQSTTDSTDNPDATYSAVLWDGASGQAIQPFGSAASFAVRPDLSSTTWANIFTAEAD